MDKPEVYKFQLISGLETHPTATNFFSALALKNVPSLVSEIFLCPPNPWKTVQYRGPGWNFFSFLPCSMVWAVLGNGMEFRH